MNATAHLLEHVQTQLTRARRNSLRHQRLDVRIRSTGRYRALRWVERRLKQIIVLEGIKV